MSSWVNFADLSFAWFYVSPDFHLAMGGDKAKDFYEEFLAQLREGESTKMLSPEVSALTMFAFRSTCFPLNVKLWLGAVHK